MESSTKDTLSKRLVQLRTERGWTQSDLVEKMYLSQRSISKIEKGECTLSNLILLADLYEVSKVLKYDENSHWYHCNDCDADIDYEEHKGGTATCIDKAVCTVCHQEYGSLDSDNHVKKSNVWSNDATEHWHEYDACHAQLDKAAHISSGPATDDNRLRGHYGA